MDYEKETWDYYQKIGKILKKHKEVKNYKELCNILKEPIKAGDSKIAQINYWNNFFTYTKIGHSFKKITLKTPEEITEYIQNKITDKTSEKYLMNQHKSLTDYIEDINNFNWKSFIFNKGVYKIQKDNSIYIGSTTITFYERFKQHAAPSNNSVTKDLLKNGYKFNILWIADSNDSIQTIRQKEEEFIQLYKSKKFCMINSKSAFGIPESEYIKLKIKKEDLSKVLQLLNENNVYIYYKEEVNYD